jgi:hypothetical protein
MQGNIRLIQFLLLVFICNTSFSQNENSVSSKLMKKNWFFSSAYGVQISGIKSEDFIRSNVAPLFQLNIGVWFTPEIALQIGYKGFYFHTISDNDKHHYNYILGEVLLNLNELIVGDNISANKWNIIFHPGVGYFYNKYYNRPNICANLGIINSIKVTNKFDVFIDVSAIVGWDIYQGDEDILPSINIGFIYTFR